MPNHRTVRRRLTTVAALLAAAGPSATAHAAIEVATAPGRVLLTTDGGRVRDDVDAGGGGFPIALPDGRTLLVGVPGPAGTNGLIVALTKAGLPDLGYGSGGAVALPTALQIIQVLRQADGRLLLVGTDRAAAPGLTPAPLEVVRLLADGSLDRSWGAGGVASTPVGIGCGACTTAAVGPDGAVAVTGTIGTYPANPTPMTVADLHWAVTRLSSDGTVDRAFGSGGVATVPDVRGSGFNVAVLADGRIATEGQTATSGRSTIMLACFTPAGAMDTSFGHGAAVVTPLAYGFPMLARADGSIVIAGGRQGSALPPLTAGRRYVAGYTAAGVPDTAFSGDGLVDTANIEVQQILPAAGSDLTLIGTPAQPLVSTTTVTPGTFSIARWRASGPPATAPAWRDVHVRFGGGGSSFLVSVHPRPLPPLAQNSFFGRQLTPRPDGSLLAVGSAVVTQPTGEGIGHSIGRTALAAFTADLAPDLSIGGPATPPAAAIALPAQRAPTARSRHGVRVRIRASGPGLWRVKVRATSGRVLAQSVLPVFARGSATLPVELTRTGNLWLRHRRRVRLTVDATARDLFGALATAGATGTLR